MKGQTSPPCIDYKADKAREALILLPIWFDVGLPFQFWSHILGANPGQPCCIIAVGWEGGRGKEGFNDSKTLTYYVPLPVTILFHFLYTHIVFHLRVSQRHCTHNPADGCFFPLSAVTCLYGAERKRRSRLFPLNVLEVIEIQFYDRNRDTWRA